MIVSPICRESLVFKAIIKGEYDMVKAPWDKVSAEGKDLVTKLLCSED
jgi:hypothetical protein